MLIKLAPYAKSIIAAVVAFLSALSTGLDGGLSGQELISALIALIIGFGAVFSVPNRAPFIPPQDTDGEQADGAAAAPTVES